LIVDCHTHLNRYSAEEPASLAERHALLLGEMDACGVDRALVLTSYKVDDDRPSTADVLAALESDDRLDVVAGVCVSRLAFEMPELRAFLFEGRVRGLKLYPGYEPFHVHDTRLAPVYALAAEFGVPVMIHTGDTFEPTTRVRYAHPLDVDDVAVLHPEVTFVLCHLGNPWFTDAMEVIYKNRNVMGDISGLTLGEFAPRFQRFATAKINDVLAYVNDPAKLMFGTDWPISSMPGYMEFARGLDATEEEMEALMGGNAARLFGLGGAVDDDHD
jgi:predicted TIM-barrel fold metal-dependent hydrolase